MHLIETAQEQEMALITRISRLFTADVHAVLDRIEEPEVVLKQAVREMADEVARGEQHLKWLNSEGQQLQQRLSDAKDTLAQINGELDLCFDAGEEDLARTLIKRKLVADQQIKQASQQLDALDREHDTVSRLLAEQRQTLTDTQQKAELLVETPSRGFAPTVSGISRDDIEVAFLKEKQRRQS